MKQNETKRRKSWKDITISDFKAIYDLQKLPDEDERLLRLLAIVEGVSYDDILEMPLSRLEERMPDMDFLAKEPRIPLMKPSYELCGTKYRVHAGELTTAQYIDFKQMADSFQENLPQFLTIFLIPEGHRYGDGYDLAKAVRDISTMSIIDARAVASFFLTACALSTRIFLRYSQRRLRRMERRARTQEEKEAAENLRKEVRRLRSLLPTIGSL